jgi:hypothetical protein
MHMMFSKHQFWKVFIWEHNHFGWWQWNDGLQVEGNQGFCVALWSFCGCSTHTHSILWGCEKCLGCTLWCAWSENNSKQLFLMKVFHHKMQEGDDMLVQ